MSLIDTYEEVEDFIENIEKVKDDIPDFDGKFWCEDYMMDILNICEEWIEAHQEEYYKVIDNCNKAGNSTEFIEFMLKMIDATINETEKNTTQETT